jgi:glucose-1-phosphatase
MVADHQGGGREGGVRVASHTLTPGSADALLFDLGGVIIDIDFNRAFARWAEHAGCDQASLRERFSPDAAYCRHEIGEIDHKAYFASLRTSLGIDIADAKFLDGWNAIFIGEIPGIAELLTRAGKRVALYAFSNSNRAHEDCWPLQFADVLGNFRKVFVSSTIGLRKPDAAAFEFVIREIGVPAGRIVFFDDNPDNVAGARACGLQGVDVRSHADVADAVAALGL